MDTRTSEPRIPTVGGGYVGMYAVPPEGAAPRRGPVTVVDPRPNMTYQPFLPEAAAGYIETRHVVVPLRRALLFGREIVSLGHIEHPRLAGESAALVQTSIPRPCGAPDESVARVASEITTKNEGARLYVEGRRP